LALSVVVHAALLMVRFVAPVVQAQVFHAPALEVTLVNAKSKSRPNSPQAYAQANLDGGGDHREEQRSSPLPASALVTDGDALEAARRAVARLEEEQRRLLATYRQQNALASGQTRAPAEAPQVGERQERQTLKRLQAQIDKELSDYQRRPRIHHFMPSTSELRFARYFEDWRSHVEKVGNQHYPDAARGHIYGSVVMTVIIDRSGSLVEALVARSSGSDVLDRAAKRIVQMAAPFAPFPPDMSDTDQIELTRSMVFTKDTGGGSPSGGELRVDK
jgi:protein TonB